MGVGPELPDDGKLIRRGFVELGLVMDFYRRITWYLTRLGAMSPREISHRLVESGKKLSDRHRSHGRHRLSRGNLAPIAIFSERLRTTDSAILAAIRRQSENAKAGRFCLLGATWPEHRMPPTPDFWHIDPDRNRIAFDKTAFCFDISLRHGVGVSEVKRIWEINRLQFLVAVAADAKLGGNTSSRDFVSATVFSWMDGNPPYRGVNWLSGIELALRTISVAVAFSIIGIDHLDDAAKLRLCRFFESHVFWIARYPSLHSSANNHFVAELAGLIVGTTFFPTMPRADDLRRQSVAKLINEITRQILPDGVGAEQAPCYTAFAIELVLLALLVVGLPADRLPAPARARIAAWAELMCGLMDMSGGVPAIGDCDDCRALAFTQEAEQRYVASIAAAVGGYLGRPDIVPASREPHLRGLLFRPPATAAIRTAGMRTWAEGGYSVIRGTAAKPFVLIVDHGPLGYLSIAAHGHADALSVWLSVADQPVLVDAGTYLYHSDPRWRDRFRSTVLHNTLTIADAPSSRPSGPFNWASKANVRLVLATSEPHPRVIAEHDGYLGRYGVRHRRTIDVLDGSSVLIADELVGGSIEESVAIAFLIDPSCKAELDSKTKDVVVSSARGNVLRFVSDGQLKPRIARGDQATGLGWVSPSFGVRLPADQIRYEGRLTGRSAIRMDIL
jgi:hypothetical protein